MDVAPGESAPPSDDTARAIVARLRDGDAQAAELLQREYREAIVRFCWGYLGQLEEAEDAFQDVCCKVLGATQVPDQFRPWLYRIARNHCLNLRRARATRREDGPVPATSRLRDALTGQLTRMVKAEQRSRLTEAVESLSEEQGEALRLRYVEELSRSEIAAVLEIPESVVKSRLFEGLKKLREHASLLE